MVTFPKTDYESLIQDGRVHCSLYTDQSLFETELEKLWYREWIFIGHESEVPQSGDYTLKWLGLQPVIMTRDEDGGVNLLLNHCAHRGATVCQDESGNSHGFRCWYHGWTYNNKGDLIGVTFADNYDASFDMQEMGLARVPRVGSYRGFVFASMSPTGIDLDTHLGLAKTEILDRLCDLSPVGEVQISTGWLKHRVESNWKMMMENACDHYHANFTHQSTRIIGRSGTRAGVAGLVAGQGVGIAVHRHLRMFGVGYGVIECPMKRTPRALPLSKQRRRRPAVQRVDGNQFQALPPSQSAWPASIRRGPRESSRCSASTRDCTRSSSGPQSPPTAASPRSLASSAIASS